MNSILNFFSKFGKLDEQSTIKHSLKNYLYLYFQMGEGKEACYNGYNEQGYGKFVYEDYSFNPSTENRDTVFIILLGDIPPLIKRTDVENLAGAHGAVNTL